MKNDYLKFVLLILILYIVIRVSLILISILGINDMYLDTETFSWLDSLFLIVLLFYIYNISIKIRSKIKREKYIFISAIIVFLTNGFDTNYLEEYYNFSNPVVACNYSQLCNIRTKMIFIEDDYAIFPDEGNYVDYYPRLEKGWKINNSLIHKSHYAKNDIIRVNVYEVGEKYFVYLAMDELIPIDNITDNSGKEFVALKGGYYNFSISNRFGKLIDSIEDYKIFINDEEVEIEKIKNSN